MRSPSNGCALQPAATACVCLAALALMACEPRPQVAPPVPWQPSFASSLALDQARGRLWLASPDDDQVVALDPDTLEVIERVSIEGRPVSVFVLGDGLLVALADRAAIARVEPDLTLIVTVPVPCGGTAAVVAPNTSAFVACPNDDRVVEIDLITDQVRRVLSTPGRPTALATTDSALGVTGSTGGRLYSFDREALEGLPEGLDPISPEAAGARGGPLEPVPGFAATRVDSLVPAGPGFVATWQRVDHDSDRDRLPERGGFGAVADGEARIEPRLAGSCDGRYARFDATARAFSGPRGAAYADLTGHLWVAHEFTDNVAVLDCSTGRPSLVASFRTGRGPRAVAVSDDGRTAWVDVGFEHAVARLSLDDVSSPDRPAEPAMSRARETGALYLSAEALRGRQIFHDAIDPDLTPNRVLACATCHPGGSDDGLNWFFHTLDTPRKLRRTSAAWGARAALAPYHWDGEFESVDALTTSTVRSLMEGPGLTVETAAITAYLDAEPIPPGRPAWDAADEALIELGAELFGLSGCMDCHPPPLFADGRLHPTELLSTDVDARLIDVDTPTLLGVRGRGPWLHDGRAATLAESISAHGGGSRVSAADMPAIVRYVESL